MKFCLETTVQKKKNLTTQEKKKWPIEYAEKKIIWPNFSLLSNLIRMS